MSTLDYDMCLITQERFCPDTNSDLCPVVGECGHSFTRQGIQKWYEGRKTDEYHKRKSYVPCAYKCARKWVNKKGQRMEEQIRAFKASNLVPNFTLCKALDVIKGVELGTAEKADEEFVHCSLCQNNYSTAAAPAGFEQSLRAPVVGLCGHTFCASCIYDKHQQAMQDSNSDSLRYVQCPQCQEKGAFHADRLVPNQSLKDALLHWEEIEYPIDYKDLYRKEKAKCNALKELNDKEMETHKDLLKKKTSEYEALKVLHNKEMGAQIDLYKKKTDECQSLKVLHEEEIETRVLYKELFEKKTAEHAALKVLRNKEMVQHKKKADEHDSLKVLYKTKADKYKAIRVLCDKAMVTLNEYRAFCKKKVAENDALNEEMNIQRELCIKKVDECATLRVLQKKTEGQAATFKNLYNKQVAAVFTIENLRKKDRDTLVYYRDLYHKKQAEYDALRVLHDKERKDLYKLTTAKCSAMKNQLEEVIQAQKDCSELYHRKSKEYDTLKATLEKMRPTNETKAGNALNTVLEKEDDQSDYGDLYKKKKAECDFLTFQHQAAKHRIQAQEMQILLLQKELPVDSHPHQNSVFKSAKCGKTNSCPRKDLSQAPAFDEGTTPDLHLLAAKAVASPGPVQKKQTPCRCPTEDSPRRSFPTISQLARDPRVGPNGRPLPMGVPAKESEIPPPLPPARMKTPTTPRFGVSDSASDSGCNQEDTGELIMEDARLYLANVKQAFNMHPEKYKEFLIILKDLPNQKNDIPAVVSRVCKLLFGHNNLILGFNKFLPDCHKFKFADIERMMQTSQPRGSKTTLLEADDNNEQAVHDKEGDTINKKGNVRGSLTFKNGDKVYLSPNNKGLRCSVSSELAGKKAVVLDYKMVGSWMTVKLMEGSRDVVKIRKVDVTKDASKVQHSANNNLTDCCRSPQVFLLETTKKKRKECLQPTGNATEANEVQYSGEDHSGHQARVLGPPKKKQKLCLHPTDDTRVGGSPTAMSKTSGGPCVNFDIAQDDKGNNSKTKEVYRGPPMNSLANDRIWPEGWVQISKERPKLDSKGKIRVDNYWISPCKKTFRSMVSVQEFMRRLSHGSSAKAIEGSSVETAWTGRNGPFAGDNVTAAAVSIDNDIELDNEMSADSDESDDASELKPPAKACGFHEMDDSSDDDSIPIAELKSKALSKE